VTTLELAPCLVARRLWVPAELRDAYRDVVSRLAAHPSDLLLRVELFEERREGFYMELHLYRDPGAWSAVREGAAPELSRLLEERRALVPEDHEEVITYRSVAIDLPGGPGAAGGPITSPSGTP